MISAPSKPPVATKAWQPPQFIVVSFDGGGWPKKWAFWRDVARRSDASFTFFLSGVYFLPGDLRGMYRPPHRPPGASDIGFTSRASLAARIEQIRAAYREGHELGSHFNGHFCGPGGVSSWDEKDWTSELDQFFSLFEHWRKNAGLKDVRPLPFGREVITGERTPCLEGDKPLLRKLLAKRGFTYDASEVTPEPAWPVKKDGIWEFATPYVPRADDGRRVALMDYELFAQDSSAVDAPSSRRPAFEKNALDTMRAAFRRTYAGSRAPLFFVNHFNEWSGGIYADAMASFVEETCPRAGVRCVSFQHLVHWLDALPPSRLAKLRGAQGPSNRRATAPNIAGW